MATHFSSLAERIPWTEELAGLESMGLQRVRHKLVTEHNAIYTHMYNAQSSPSQKKKNSPSQALVIHEL